MQAPPAVFVDMMSNVPSYFNFPFRPNGGACDVQGKYETRKQEAWPTVVTTPMTRFELKILKEQEAIDCGFGE